MINKKQNSNRTCSLSPRSATTRPHETTPVDKQSRPRVKHVFYQRGSLDTTKALLRAVYIAWVSTTRSESTREECAELCSRWKWRRVPRWGGGTGEGLEEKKEKESARMDIIIDNRVWVWVCVFIYHSIKKKSKKETSLRNCSDRHPPHVCCIVTRQHYEVTRALGLWAGPLLACHILCREHTGSIIAYLQSACTLCVRQRWVAR